MLQPALVPNTLSCVVPASLHSRPETGAVFEAAEQTLTQALMKAQAVRLPVNRDGLFKRLISEKDSHQAVLLQFKQSECMTISCFFFLKSSLIWLSSKCGDLAWVAKQQVPQHTLKC